MKDELHPEITRRAFMEGTWKALNITAFITLGGFLGGLPALAISSGHPSSITCYECRACAGTCPWKFDPAGFSVAARTNNPNRRMIIQFDPVKYNHVVVGMKASSGLTRDEFNEMVRSIDYLTQEKKDRWQYYQEVGKTLYSLLIEIQQENDGKSLSGEKEKALEDLERMLNLFSASPGEFERLAIPYNLYIRDPHLKIKVKEDDEENIMTIKEAVKKGLNYSNIIEMYEMRAKDAAYFCPMCGNCEPPCPVRLPITKYIIDLKPDGVYR